MIVVFDIGNVLLRWNPRYLFRKTFADEARMEHFLATACAMDFVAHTDIAPDFSQAIAARVEGEAGDHLLAAKVCSGALDDDGTVRLRVTDDAGGWPAGVTESANLAGAMHAKKAVVHPATTPLARAIAKPAGDVEVGCQDARGGEPRARRESAAARRRSSETSSDGREQKNFRHARRFEKPSADIARRTLFLAAFVTARETFLASGRTTRCLP